MPPRCSSPSTTPNCTRTAAWPTCRLPRARSSRSAARIADDAAGGADGRADQQPAARRRRAPVRARAPPARPRRGRRLHQPLPRGGPRAGRQRSPCCATGGRVGDWRHRRRHRRRSSSRTWSGATCRELFPPAPADAPRRPRCCASSDLSAPPVVRDVSLTVRRGEMLGIAGLVGSGRTEFVRALMGLGDARRRRRRAGERRSRSTSRPRHPVGRAWRVGLGYLSEDRKGEGLALPMSVADNITCTRYRDAAAAHGVIASPAQRAQATALDGAAARQGPHAGPAGADAVGRQPAEGGAGAADAPAGARCCCSTSRRAASTSAARCRLYEAIARGRCRGQGRARGQLVSAGAVRRLRLAGGDAPGHALAHAPDRASGRPRAVMAEAVADERADGTVAVVAPAMADASGRSSAWSPSSSSSRC